MESPQQVRALLAGSQLPTVPEAVSSPPRQWLLFTATGTGVLSSELAQAEVHLHTSGLGWPCPTSTGIPDPAAVAGTTRAQHRRTA